MAAVETYNLLDNASAFPCCAPSLYLTVQSYCCNFSDQRASFPVGSLIDNVWYPQHQCNAELSHF